MKRTPLYRDTRALCGVLLQSLEEGDAHGPVRRRLADGVIRLFDLVVLALGGRDLRLERVTSADDELRTLRAQILLAHDLDVLDEETTLALIEQAERVGRQIGGWLRKLASVS